MALDSDQGERTEEATAQQRREDFRDNRGQVAQTRELGSGFYVICFLSPGFGFQENFSLSRFLSFSKSHSARGIAEYQRSGAGMLPAGRLAVEYMFLMLAPVLGLLFLIAFAATALQTGFIYNEEALQFRPERLDPVQGFFSDFQFESLGRGTEGVT